MIHVQPIQHVDINHILTIRFQDLNNQAFLFF